MDLICHVAQKMMFYNSFIDGEWGHRKVGEWHVRRTQIKLSNSDCTGQIISKMNYP